MFRNKKILGLIGARGGSRGLPDKNIVDCAGKPLIQWTIEAANNSKYLDRIIISSESKKIIEVSKEKGGDAPFIRPQELAADDASMLDVIHHARKWLEENEGQVYDYLMLLQPTSPLRTSEHIDEAIEYYFSNQKGESDTLVAVYKVNYKVGWLVRDTKDNYVDFCFDVSKTHSKRQDLGNYYIPNGAIYFASAEKLTTFYNGFTRCFIMPEEVSVDVDTPEDLEKAARYLNGP